MQTRAKFAIAGFALLVLAAGASWWIEAAAARILEARHALPPDPLGVSVENVSVAEGERLTHVDACFSCHGKALTGGVVFTGLFGTRLVAPNLTHIAHRRSDKELAAATRYGIKKDGTSLIDMPSSVFLKSSDADIASIVAYLKSLPEKPNTAGKTQWRLGGYTMLAMGFLPPSTELIKGVARGPVQTPVEDFARGRYLTHVHCSGCHGPTLAGEPEQDSPDLRFAIKHYSLGVFERFFATGIARKGHGTDTMTPLIRRRMHYLTKADVRAIFVYLNNSKPG